MLVSPVFISFFNTTHLRLTEHLQTVLTDELQQLAVRQAEELVFFRHLGHKRTREHDQMKTYWLLKIQKVL